MPRVKRIKTDEELADEIEETIMNPDESLKMDEPVDFVNTGSTVLNLAASGKAKDGGWARGRVVNIVGDGSSGKTLLALEAAAVCLYTMKGHPATDNWPEVKKIDVVYNNAEGVMDFPVEEMYGEDFRDRIEWISTKYVEDFGRDLCSRLSNMKPGHFMLYVVDSFDALKSQTEAAAFEKEAEQMAKGKKVKSEGTYGLDKQKYTSKFFRNIVDFMEGKDCLLLIISQTRQKIGVTFGDRKCRTGGDALNFYTHQVCWLAEIKKLARTVKGHLRTYGIRTKAKFKRNKTAKPFRDAEIVILYDYGVDDVGSMLDWLHGPEEKAVEFKGKNFKTKKSLLKYIEENNLEDELIEEVGSLWKEIEDKLKPSDRKRKYS